MAQDAEKLAEQSARLRAIKQQQRFKFREIAEAVAVTERQVQRWFSGDSDIAGENLKALASYLGTTPDYIEYGEDRPSRTPNLMRDLNGSDDLIVGQMQVLDAKLDRILSLLGERMDDLEREIAVLALEAQQQTAEVDEPRTALRDRLRS